MKSRVHAGLKLALRILVSTFLLTLAVLITGCAGPISLESSDKECPLYSGLGPIRVNPSGAKNQHLHVEVAIKVCPAEEGLAEIKRKKVELKHSMISLLSSQTEEELENPLRAEKLRKQIREIVNEQVLRKSEAVDVLLTSMWLE